MTREQDALGRTIDTTYAALDQVATVKDKRGTIVTTTYASSTAGCDYTNRPKESRLNILNGVANVLLSSYCWNSNATLNYSRAYSDATRYRETRLTYEAASNGLNVSQEQIVGMPSGITITKTYTYDTLGRKKTETLPRRTSPTNAALINLTTSYDYDALDRVIKTTDSLGNEAINHFDANGQLWKVTHRYKNPDTTYDVRDVSTRLFDAADRVLMEADAEANIASNTYDAAGNIISVMDAEGHVTRFEYDEMNRRTAVIDATGYRTDTTLTLRGDVVAMTNANNETVQLEIDALGRKTAAIDARGYRTEFQYDANNNLTCTIDANAQAGLQPKNALGCSQSQQYDELNRVVKTTDALNGETKFTYDLLGNRLTITDAENKPYSFAYDDLSRLISETDHSAKASTYLLDEASNPYQTTNRLAEVSRYTYDNANRLTRIDYLKDGSAETFGYDAAGNKASSANNLVGYSFIYDRLNRLTQKRDSRNAQLSFTYDKADNLLTKTTYQNTTTSYLYNAANRLVSLTNLDYLQADYQLDPAGRVLSRVSNSGARTMSQYDANGWVTKLTQYDAANNLVSDTSYTRDRVGNILTQINTAGANTGTTTFSYDALYRLSTADYPSAANDELFTYDKVGNRKTATKGSLIANTNTRYYGYFANTNRLAEIRIGSAAGTLDSSFTNDFEGRLTAQTGTGAKTLTWDAKSRLKTITKASITQTYGYDPMDYRIRHSNTANGQLDYYLEGEHLESVEQNGQLTEKYFRGASTDELIAAYLKDTDGKSKPYQFHHDTLTSTTQVTGHNGGTLQSITYSAFGSTLNQTGISPNRLKYTGREDDGTGLYYYRARYYDTDIGRFISEDPLGFEVGINFYAYVNNNPVNANDPSGLDPLSAIVKIGGRLGSAETRGHVVQVANEWLAKGWQLISGGGTPETLIKNAAGGSKGGAYADIQLYHPETAQTLRINTIDTYANGLPTAREAANGVRIQSLKPNDQFMMIPKPSAGQVAVGATAGLGASNAQAAGSGILGSGVSWGDVGSFILDFLTPGGISGVGAGSDIVPRAPSVTPSFSGANGGFLLYPNKSNNNMMQSVYSK
ncbi:MAG: RHS repeat-associated core domain-containing protein [Methylotenera sp.]|nr:RHS repeat-associated core domain-containing protein [Methylotenera sp.]MDO9234203.1 RHS repeat-associated core domain-containing protein [Methylotenera sp.]MDP2403124.1 RHS repeat-associated core domain-containing protein [Methylotenera sp.]MDP3096167.1 RHS repeat-associated core domain-containing protein [Methylotenera sp.]MDZ4223082.1 RHS repeat-associated core domain-containing protein [Methylotenera sp.]